ncbi:hypothetical protein QFC22_005292 [Naganishia vaughanmartiniae]|uniref:Uncharacterized protein n=1 Tax=Naganishia vaughanmartiniae TaxID=1424756 RepID=A0ACC2WWL8_9TREE|nr:hypothetical protein QFC22_005292 [Naganishia vaughanmartiniae]
MVVDNKAGKLGPSSSTDMAPSMPGFEDTVGEKSTEKGDGNGRDGGGDGAAAVHSASATTAAQAGISTSADEAEPTASLLSNTTTLAAETNTSTIMHVDDDTGKLAPSTSTDMASSLPVSEGVAIETSTENGEGDAGNVGGVGDIVMPLGSTQAGTTPPASSTANGTESHTPARPETLPETQPEPANEAAEQDDPTPDGIPTAWLLSGTDTEDVFLWDVQSRQCLQRIHTQSYDLSEGDRVQPKGHVQAAAGGSATAQTAGDGQGKQSVEKEKSGNGEVGREDKPTLALAAHPFRREIAVGGLGGRWGNVVSVWRSS